jgi:NTE family protein
MKLSRVFLFVMLLLAPVLHAQSTPAHRPRVALALSGGGSLGLAHLGVLQYFEEHHIPVDAIAGTSMGGIVGGLYAAGHSPAEIEAAFADAGWDDLLRVQPRYQDLPIQAREDRVHYPGQYVLRLGRSLSLPAGISTAEPLDLFLSRQLLAYSKEDDFAQLPTPFRCVATQLETGELFVLRRGNLARALRASMAVPGIFTPVEWEGRVLVDGGLVDNLPTDVAREMGADVVIAVHFSIPVPPARQLQSLPNVLTQAVSVAVSVTERESLRNADLVLAPSFVGIGGVDIAHARELIERGYQSAAQKQRFLATLALSDAEWDAYLAARRSRMKPVPAPPTRIIAQSSDTALARYAQGELDRTTGAESLPRIERELSTLVASSALPGAFYRLSPTQPDALVAEVEPRSGSQLFIRPSLELAIANGEPTRGALRGFATLLPQDAFRARYRVQFSLGYSPLIAAEYEHPIAAQWFWSPSLNLERRNSATYLGSSHFTHWQDSYSAALDLGYGQGQRFQVRSGLEAGYEHVSDRTLLGALPVRNGAFLSPHVQADWNSLDDPSLPTRGELFSASLAGRYRNSDGRIVPLAQASLSQHLSILSGTLSASLAAATSFGNALNYYDLFPVGGPTNLRAFRYQQFHASSYATGGLAYRKPLLRNLKLLGERPQLGAWYDAAGLTQPAQTWQSAQSGSVGVLMDSPLGVVTFAIGHTSDHQTRAWINVGRP